MSLGLAKHDTTVPLACRIDGATSLDCAFLEDSQQLGCALLAAELDCALRVKVFTHGVCSTNDLFTLPGMLPVQLVLVVS